MEAGPAIDLSLKQPQQLGGFAFNVGGESRSFTLSARPLDREHTSTLNFVIQDGTSPVARVRGSLEQTDPTKRSFYVDVAYNFRHIEDYPQAAPGVVTEAVVQLLMHNAVDEWYSSNEALMSPDARSMYARLGADARVILEMPSEQNHNRYIVRRNPAPLSGDTPSA